MTGFHPVRRRSGVSESVMQRNRSVQTPVSLVSVASGSALRLPVSAAQTSHANGPRAVTKTSGFRKNRRMRSGKCNDSVVLSQIHARVELGHLVAVAVEHQRLAPEELADAPLGRLGPPWVIDRRFDVGVET